MDTNDRTYLLVAVLLFFIGVSNVGAQKRNDRELFEKKEYSDYGVTLPYRILYPENMGKGKKYPIFVVLHGVRKRGTDNEKQLDMGSAMFLNSANRKKYPCIVVYPQAPETSAFVRVKKGNSYLPGGWQMFTEEGLASGELSVEFTVYGRLVHGIIAQLAESDIVDAGRIYITGFSMGACTTYQLLTKYPDLVAAVAPIAGATLLSDVEKWAGKTPVWIIHGDTDTIVPVDASREVVRKLKGLNVTTYKYTEYPDRGHDEWIKAFADSEFLPWFFSHKKQ